MCGIYAIINAFRALCREITWEISTHLFQHLVSCLNRHAKQALFPIIFGTGTITDAQASRRSTKCPEPGIPAGLGSKSGTQPTLTEEDAAAIRRELPDVQVAAPLMSRSMPLVAGNKNWVTLVAGVNPDYLVAREWQAANGRSFTGDEIASGAKVAIVGSVISEELFGGRVGIGETFRIGSVPFTVVGVLDKKGLGAAGRSQDDIVFIPLSTAKSRVLGAVRGTTREALDFISSYLKKRLKIELAIEPKRRELKSKSLEAAWQRLSAIVDETTVLILPLSGRLDHWTVLYDINARKIRLVDSSHRRELTRSRCTLGAAKKRYCLELSGAIAISTRYAPHPDILPKANNPHGKVYSPRRARFSKASTTRWRIHTLSCARCASTCPSNTSTEPQRHSWWCRTAISALLGRREHVSVDEPRVPI